MLHLSATRVIGLLTTACGLRAAEIKPLSVNPSQYWDGNDGKWNSFPIQVGSNRQVVRVFPATAVSVPWVVLPEGCPLSNDTPADCNQKRGGIFSSDQSMTWVNSSINSLGVEQNLNYTDSNAGDYGYDRLGLGFPGSGGPTLENQTIAGIVTKQWHLGVLGLNPEPINLTDYNHQNQSLLSSLRTAGAIPSLSYGYTAGAFYRYKRVLASLTLGGYDRSRFRPNNIRFTSAPDNSRDLVVVIRSVVATNATGVNFRLLNAPTRAYIDSTVPHIWLPQDVCEAFEAAFGITWDPTTGLYLVNETQHGNLKLQNPNITFELGNDLTGGPTTFINLPYDSFDLSVSWPIVGDTTSYYFPLRRAADETQVTLGRTFLQEAYLTVDYERGNFSVSQAVFEEYTPPAELVPIKSTDSSDSTNTPIPTNIPDPYHLSSGAIAGIVVGVILLIAFALFVIIHYRKRKLVRQQVEQASKDQLMQLGPLPELDGTKTPIVQIEGEHMVEADTQCVPAMADSTPLHEMDSATPVHETSHELAGDEPRRSELHVGHHKRSDRESRG